MKKLKGIVVRQTMDKTAVVRVDRDWRHPIYHKTVKRSKKYLVHDPEGKAQVNKKIVIAETKPISRRKRWVLTEVES